jgi:acyl-coenzyme A synthetase/AMP-(fatty) acid ligase
MALKTLAANRQILKRIGHFGGSQIHHLLGFKGRAVNIVDPILFQCRINAEQPAICAPGARLEPVTYAQLGYLLNSLTRTVLQFKFKPGDIVGVLLNDKIFHVVLTLALARIGVVTVSCRGRSLPKELGAAAVFVDTLGPFDNVNRIITAEGPWTRGDGSPVLSDFVANGNELCRIILTSGSTGSAKGVAFSHKKLFEKNARLDYTRLDRWSRSSRMFCDLGLSSSLGFYYVLYMLGRGGMIMLLGEDTVGTLQSLNLFQMQNMASSPYGLAEYLKFYESQPTFGCNFDHILVAGGALTKQLAARAWARMSPNLITTYGAAETGAVASGDARVTTEVPGAVGYVLPDAQAEIVDASDRPLQRGKEGIVRVRTAQMADRYLGDPVTSARHFRDGWFYPGDIGYLRDDDLLVMTGRQETLLNVGGDKINPEIVEEVLSSFQAVADSAVLNMPNELGIEEIHALIVTHDSLDETMLRNYCAQHLQHIFIPVRFIKVKRIPRNDMAKIERGKLMELVRAAAR